MSASGEPGRDAPRVAPPGVKRLAKVGAYPAQKPDDPNVLSRLAWMVDGLIPGDIQFPSATEAGIESAVLSFLDPHDGPTKHFPLDRAEFEDCVLASPVAPVSPAAELTALQSARPEFFGLLLLLTYHCYYSSLAVVVAVQQHLEAGRDYQPAPMPYGYRDTVDDWGGRRPQTTSTWTRTDAVRRVDLTALPASVTGSQPG